MSNILVDFNTKVGKIKPMHAVNNVQTVPFCHGDIDYLANAHVPYSRLHDTGGCFGGAHYVDIGNIFPNFDADENDPLSYDFAFTDVLLQNMLKSGIKPFYRLGATIENRHKIKAYNIFPPKDPEKWARICEHIILHYNEGWADGFRMDIEYWEIWNEPDNQPEIEENPCWKGTKEQFFELYRIASKHLKSRFPHLKIGGYASCGFYALTNSFIKAANSSPRKEYFLEFFEDFLKYAQENECVLDFFSWHSYASLDANVIYARHARERLDAFGFDRTEVFLNEWNPGNHNRALTRDAADILAMMIAMHSTPTDMLMYYDAYVHSSYCGIFDPVGHGVFKAYYAFLVFGKMYVMGEKCQSHSDENGVYVIAARGDEKKAFAIVNDSEEEKSVTLSVIGADLPSGKVMATDDAHEFDEILPLDNALVLPPFSIRYVEFD